MEYLILQTAAWMLAAYFLGAMAACFIRRFFFRPHIDEAVTSTADWQVTSLKPAPVAAGAPVIETGPQEVPVSVSTNAMRFERALSQAPQTMPAATVVQPPVAEPVQTQTIQTPAVPVVAPSQPEFLPPTGRDQPKSKLFSTVDAAAAAAAASAVAATFSGSNFSWVRPDTPTQDVTETAESSIPQSATTSETNGNTVVETVRLGVPQDLRRIRSIDQNIATRLNSHGIYRYEQLARLSNQEIEQLEKDLGITERFSSESWVAQAELLAAGTDTSYTRGRGRHGSGSDIWASKTATRTLLAKPAVNDIEQPLTERKRSGAEQAVVAAAAIAAATAAANRTSGVLGRAPRSDHKTKKSGAEEERSKNIEADTTASTSPTVELRPAKLSDAIMDKTGQPTGFVERSTPQPSMAALRSVKSEGLRGVDDHQGEEDDLKRIRGIGVLVEKKLNSIGVKSFDQIANWEKDDIKRVSDLLDFQGRIEREHWIEQARLLSS